MADPRPLWEVMEESTGTVAEWGCVIRAVADWLVPEEPQQEPYVNSGLGWVINTDNANYWAERQRLRALLTAEADRAERGETVNPSEND